MSRMGHSGFERPGKGFDLGSAQKEPPGAAARCQERPHRPVACQHLHFVRRFGCCDKLLVWEDSYQELVGIARHLFHVQERNQTWAHCRYCPCLFFPCSFSSSIFLIFFVHFLRALPSPVLLFIVPCQTIKKSNVLTRRLWQSKTFTFPLVRKYSGYTRTKNG